MTVFDSILQRVRRPSRYLGSEVNAVFKDPREVRCRVALAYPDLYELAMSYLGLQVLYQAVNREEDLWAERVFAPGVDLGCELRGAGLPLCSLESRTPLHRFDLVGFTLQHELTYPDVPAMLMMGRVPLRAEQREERHPLVVAGGPGAANPEPLAPMLDAVFLGDGEEGLVEMARTVGEGRARGAAREEILDALMALPGVYIPSRYRPEYDRKGVLQCVVPLGGAPAVVRRRLLADLDRAAPPARPLVPCSQTVHERLAVEIQRGCTRGCRFCQAGMINRPVRQRSAGRILQAVDSGLRNTGFEQVSLLSLSAGDHPRILELIEEFFARHQAERVSVSLPSLRAETLTPKMARLVRTVRKSGFTIAPEAGSARLRSTINKSLTDADVLEAAMGAFAAGWRLIKLYFMVGLPGERAEDRQAIVDLVSRVRAELRSAGHRPRINVGLSTFVPKAHTPFQWEPMADAARAAFILADIRQGLGRLPGVRVGWTRPEMSWAEGLLARGNRRLAPALEQLCASGQRLLGWSENFDPRLFGEPFYRLGLPGMPDGHVLARNIEEVLPWDHLDLGPRKEFLAGELARARAGEITRDCAGGECLDCGACAPEGAAPMLDEAPIDSPEPIRGADCEGPPARVRLVLARRGAARHLSHREFVLALCRALRRAGWPLVYTQGFHPKPKMSNSPACPVGVESAAELAEVTIREDTDIHILLERLEGTLPRGMELISGAVLPAGAPGLSGRGLVARYRFLLGARVDPGAARAAADSLMKRKEWLTTRVTKGRRKTVDLRPSIKALEIAAGPDGVEARCTVALDSSCAARPAEVVREMFGFSDVDIIREVLLPAGDPGTGAQT